MTTPSMNFPFCPTKIAFFWGGGIIGFPKFLFHRNPHILGDIGTHVKFQNPIINPSGRKVTPGERGGEIEKTQLILVT